MISAYEPSCEHLRRFGYDQIEFNLGALAYLSTGEGDLFASEANTGLVRYLAIPPPGPIIVPSSLEVASVGIINGQVNVEVNAEGEETDVVVQYVDEESWEAEGFEGPDTREGSPTELGAEFGVQGAEAAIGCEELAEGECLVPGTKYHYRAIATNVDGEDVVEAPDTFETPPHLRALWAQEVGTETAVLGASVDPLGIATTAHFEYVDEASFAESGFAEAISAPAEAELEFGAGFGAVIRSAPLAGLAEGVNYRYRIVIADPLATDESEPKGFKTQAGEAPTTGCANDATRLGAAAFLPDCRAYEMVSPLDKEGGEIKVQPQGTTNLPATLDQAAVSGQRLTYGSYRAFAGPESAPYTSQYLAERGAGGWASHSISPPQDGLIREGIETDNEFRYFSDELCEGWLTAFAEFPEDIGQVPGYFNLYRRSDRLCGAEGFTPLSTAKPTTQVPDGLQTRSAGRLRRRGGRRLHRQRRAGRHGGAGRRPRALREGSRRALALRLRLAGRISERLGVLGRNQQRGTDRQPPPGQRHQRALSRRRQPLLDQLQRRREDLPAPQPIGGRRQRLRDRRRRLHRSGLRSGRSGLGDLGLPLLGGGRGRLAGPLHHRGPGSRRGGPL